MIKKQFSKTKQMCKVTFTLPKKAAKNAKVVKVLGDFNGWNWRKGVKMTPSRSDFKAVLELETGRKYQFRYMIDNKIWENDWAADEYIPNDFGMNNSVVVLPKVKGVPVKKSAMKKVSAKSRTTTKKSTTSRSKSATAKKKPTTSRSKSSVAKKKSTSKSKPVAKKMTTSKSKSMAKKKSTASKKKTVAKKSTSKRMTASKKSSTSKRMPSSKKSMSTKMSMTSKVRVIKQTDLTVIEGVGPKICQLLNKGGVNTFAQMAKCTPAKLKTMLAKGGNRYQMHNPTSWPKQAKLAANNKWSELKKMQAKMK